MSIKKIENKTFDDEKYENCNKTIIKFYYDWLITEEIDYLNEYVTHSCILTDKKTQNILTGGEEISNYLYKLIKDNTVLNFIIYDDKIYLKIEDEEEKYVNLQVNFKMEDRMINNITLNKIIVDNKIYKTKIFIPKCHTKRKMELIHLDDSDSESELDDSKNTIYAFVFKFLKWFALIKNSDKMKELWVDNIRIFDKEFIQQSFGKTNCSRFLFNFVSSWTESKIIVHEYKIIYNSLYLKLYKTIEKTYTVIQFILTVHIDKITRIVMKFPDNDMFDIKNEFQLITNNK
jgi:hypothetical protein